MQDTKSITLEGKLEDIGTLHFLRAEWQRDISRFVLIRYSLNGDEQPFGLRLDLDKRVFLDSLDDPKVDESVQERIPEILSIIATARSQPVSPYPDDGPLLRGEGPVSRESKVEGSDPRR
jgi:hypothetical protein